VIELCAGEGRRGMMWWNLEVWRLKVVRRKNNHGVWSVCRKGGESSHKLRCEETKIWRDQILEKELRNVYAEIGMRRIVGCKKKEQWQKIGVCMNKYKEKWEQLVRMHESEAEINPGEKKSAMIAKEQEDVSLNTLMHNR
jgi:hypothetical protein